MLVGAIPKLIQCCLDHNWKDKVEKILYDRTPWSLCSECSHCMLWFSRGEYINSESFSIFLKYRSFFFKVPCIGLTFWGICLGKLLASIQFTFGGSGLSVIVWKGLPGMSRSPFVLELWSLWLFASFEASDF